MNALTHSSNKSWWKYKRVLTGGKKWCLVPFRVKPDFRIISKIYTLDDYALCNPSTNFLHGLRRPFLSMYMKLKIVQLSFVSLGFQLSTEGLLVLSPCSIMKLKSKYCKYIITDYKYTRSQALDKQLSHSSVHKIYNRKIVKRVRKMPKSFWVWFHHVLMASQEQWRFHSYASFPFNFPNFLFLQPTLHFHWYYWHHIILSRLKRIFAEKTGAWHYL